MAMPKSISTWLMIAFFLLAGLLWVGVSAIPTIIIGLVALATAVFLFLGR
jgi:hypothetical protein